MKQKELTRHDLKKSITQTGLTPKQEAFCQWYVALNANGTQAIYRSYNVREGDIVTASSMATEILHKPAIIARVKELWNAKQEQENRVPLRDRIVQELKELAFQSENEQTKNRALDTLARIEKLYSELELRADKVSFNVTLTEDKLTKSPKMQDNQISE